MYRLTATKKARYHNEMLCTVREGLSLANAYALAKWYSCEEHYGVVIDGPGDVIRFPAQ